MATTANDVYAFFESSFRDKHTIAEELELIWLRRAVARYNTELEALSFNPTSGEFENDLDDTTIGILAAFMKQSYQEREVSRINKHISIVGKDISIDGTGNAKTAAKSELEYDSAKSEYMVNTQKPTAYV